MLKTGARVRQTRERSSVTPSITLNGSHYHDELCLIDRFRRYKKATGVNTIRFSITQKLAETDLWKLSVAVASGANAIGADFRTNHFLAEQTSCFRRLCYFCPARPLFLSSLQSVFSEFDLTYSHTSNINCGFRMHHVSHRRNQWGK